MSKLFSLQQYLFIATIAAMILPATPAAAMQQRELTGDEGGSRAAIGTRAAAMEHEARAHALAAVPSSSQAVVDALGVSAAATTSLFPAMSEMNSLALMPPPVQVAIDRQEIVAAGQHVAVPLPPAAWTGLAGLAALALIGCRKALFRFVV